TANWNFWEWGRTRYGVKEKLSRLSQANYRKQDILDNIELEVKQAFLRTKETEKNITTVEKAIEQAKENLRITEERYKEQVSTTTDVLVAQTLLTETMTNYYNALYDFKIAKAVLYRAIGQEILE
ncbi:MAG: TolC family protein, partial [bacterium]|nr:TolC family protein [bacterium]